MKAFDKMITFLRNHVNQLPGIWFVLSLLLGYQSNPIYLMLTLVAKLLLRLPLSPQWRKITLALFFVIVLLAWLARIAFADCVPADGHTCTLLVVG